MSERRSFDQPLPPVDDPQASYRRAIHNKVDIAWGSAIGDQGYANPYEIAIRVHDALYRPSVVIDGMDARARAANADITEDTLPSHRLWPETREGLVGLLALRGSAPESDSFVSAVAGAILHGADVARTVLPEAREQIKHAAENGDRPAIWSAGHREHQFRKLGKSGIYAEDMEAFEPPIEVSLEHGEPITLKTIIAVDKTTKEALTRVQSIAGSDQIIVIDDRVKNLRTFRATIPETKAAIWVQYGAHAQNEIDRFERGENAQLAEDIRSGKIIPISNINQLTAKIAELRQGGLLTKARAAIFFDYDDTLANNAQRRGMELDAVVGTIFSNGWA